MFWGFFGQYNAKCELKRFFAIHPIIKMMISAKMYPFFGNITKGIPAIQITVD
jgi:hypothetical protein